MKQIYFTIFLFLGTFQFCIAQFVDFSFEHTEREYTSLSGATNITDNFLFDGDYLYISLGFETPVNISTSEGDFSLDSIMFYVTEMEMFMFNDDPELESDTYLGLLPFDLLLESTQLDGDIENETEIYYLFQDGITYFEFINMKFYKEELKELFPEARFTFTVSVRHSDGQINYHYGPSNYAPSTLEYLDEDIIIGLQVSHYTTFESFEQLGVVSDSGDELNLDVYSGNDEFNGDGISFLPAENILFSFYLNDPTSQKLQTADLNVQIFPNPGSNELHLIFDNHNYLGKVEIFNTAGQRVMTNLPLSNQVIDTGMLPAGFYSINFMTDKGIQSLKWIKI